MTTTATYDAQALDMEVGVISSFGRRYLEALLKLDRLMPMLRTLEIYEVITTSEADKRRALCKKQVRGVAMGVRILAGGLRKRMNEAGAALCVRNRCAASPWACGSWPAGCASG